MIVIWSGCISNLGAILSRSVVIVASIEAWLCGAEAIGGAFAVEYRLAVLAGLANVLKVLFAATLGNCDLKHPLNIMLINERCFDVASCLSLLKFWCSLRA